MINIQEVGRRTNNLESHGHLAIPVVAVGDLEHERLGHVLRRLDFSQIVDEFAGLFANFVIEQSGGADEPIDRRVFELRGGQLIEFDGPVATA